MKDKEIKKIIVKYINQEANVNELKTLDIWLKNKDNKSLFDQYVKIEYLTANYLGNYDVDKAKAAIKTKINEKKIAKRNLFLKRISIAASIIILLGVSFTQFIGDNKIQEDEFIPTNIQVGSSKATLTLEDGSQITLEKGKSFKTQNAKSNGNEIVYVEDRNRKKEITYNYLTIPRGGEFFIKLADGTQVWLNSESQLKYPTTFIEGKTRQVELVYGEAYFDVSPSTEHKGSKFKVINKSQEVNVLGTEFNIKAYRDEANIYTTLVEGKVAVSIDNNRQNLIPNEQLNYSLKSKTFSVEKVDVYNEISWKEGVFSFEEKPLKEIMKVLSRWYDMEVVFENKSLENIKFFGVLDKKQKIVEIMETIKKFKIIESYDIKENVIVLK
jgi:transmembrane sensor